MIVISDIDENGINTNLHVRYKQDIIYVSFCGQEENVDEYQKLCVCVCVYVCVCMCVNAQAHVRTFRQ